MVSPKSAPAVPDEGTDEAVQLLQELVGTDDKAEDPEESPIDPDTIQSRLEDLLSKQNLSEDAFIQQHMNAQMYIPLAILALHHSLRVLGDETSVLSAAKAAAQRSEKIGVDDDGTMVRPLLKPRRNTLILHGLPDTFPEEELTELFNGSPEGESFLSLKPDVNNTAFVSFKTDEAAQNAALWLRSQKLQGAEIKCAVKSEHFVRSFYPASAGPSMQASSPYMIPGSPAYQAWGYPPWMPANMSWPANAQGEQFADPNMANMGWGDATGWPQDGWPQDGSSQGSFQRDGKGDGKGKSPKGKGKGRKRGSLGGSFSQSDMSTMESGSDFNSPMLGAVGPAETAIEGLPEPGYTHEYRKYSRQYIIEVCNAMDETVKPESYEKCEQNDVLLFRSSPCKDWAPLPTPMNTFASSFFDDKRGSESVDGEGQRPGDRATRKASWGPKGSSKGESHDYEESDWSHGDSSWRKGGAGAAGGRQENMRRPQANAWGGGKAWDFKQPDGAWQSDGGYGQQQQQWVKKEAKTEQEATEWDDSGPRKMSWADKVKGAEPSDRAQRWVAKPKPNEEAKNKDEEGDPNTASDSAAAPPTEEAASAKAASTAATTPAEAAPQAAPADTVTAAGAAAASPTWADKVRQSANNSK